MADDLNTLREELAAGDWNYQRVRGIALRLEVVTEEDLAAVSNRLELLSVLTSTLLLRPAGPPEPRDNTAAELARVATELEALRGLVEPAARAVMEADRSGPTWEETRELIVAAVSEAFDAREVEAPDNSLTALVFPVWVLVDHFVFGVAADEMELQGLKVQAAREAPGHDVRVTPALEEVPPYLKEWTQQPGRTAAPTAAPTKPLAGNELLAAAEGVNITVEKQGHLFVAASRETGAQTFSGMSPNAARSKCYAAAVRALSRP
jgi:hypothetical protein